MAVFTAVQPLADTFCFWLPLYYEAKLAAAVYLWANGAPLCLRTLLCFMTCCAGYGCCVSSSQLPEPRPAAAAAAAGLTLWCCALPPSCPAGADLAGAQHVWARWFQPAVSQYEPLVDRRLAESKAVAKDWLHSNSMRLLALAQARVLAWLASVQQQAAAAAGRPAAPAAAAAAEEEEEPAALRGRDAPRTTRRRGAASPAKRASGKAAGGAGEVPEEGLQARTSSFSLSTFFSARSGDLQAEDLAAGLKSLKAYPLDHDDC